jgi:hypothetical protein
MADDRTQPERGGLCYAKLGKLCCCRAQYLSRVYRSSDCFPQQLTLSTELPELRKGLDMKLLASGASNVKLSKAADAITDAAGEAIYCTAGLSLMPSNRSGYEVCAHKGGCEGPCVLWAAGRSNMPSVREARIRKTRHLFESRKAFLSELHSDLSALERKALKLGQTAICRLNVASDLAWESMDRSLFEAHDVQYYDYTKDAKRAARSRDERFPKNYELVYSLNERSNHYAVEELLSSGINVAAVFDTVYRPSCGRIDTLPAEHRILGKAYRVIDGDTHDIRLRDIDGTGVIIGLRGKGGREKVLEGLSSGFIIPVCGGVGELSGRPLRHSLSVL